MKKYALLVGVEEYRDKMISRLNFARADATALAERLSDRCGFDSVRVLADDSGDNAPDLVNIVTALRDAAGELRQDDLFLFFFAGHGIEKDGHGYLMARDSLQAFPEHGSLSLELLRKTFGDLNASKRILLLDACRNSPQAGRSYADNPMADAISRDLVATARLAKMAGSTTVLLSACHSGQRAYEWPAKGHGVFTHYLLEGMDGAAWSDDRLEFRDLAAYSVTQVREWSSNTPGLGGPQKPWYEEFGDPCSIFLTMGPLGVAVTVKKAEPASPPPKPTPTRTNASVSLKGHEHMGTTKCSKCGRNISTTASKCPGCGTPSDNMGAAAAGLETLVTLGKIIQDDGSDTDEARAGKEPR